MSVDLSTIEPLLEDAGVMEVMINRYDEIYVERNGKLEKTDLQFDNEEHLYTTMQALVATVGRQINDAHPIVDIQLADGTLVNIVTPPIAAQGTAVTMRKFTRNEFSMDDLIGFSSLSPQIAEFLRACIGGGLNVVMAGGTGSGKTTVFNVLSEYINPEERIISIEHVPELNLRVRHLVRMFARPANLEGKGAVTTQVLIRNALKMRPERIILSEAHGGEVMEMLQAMNTGHDGSMFTIHANGIRDALSRIEVMATMSGVDAPLLTIREQIASAIHLITSQQRLHDGTRKITKIAEVTGVQGGVITTEDIFTFEESGMDGERVTGKFTPTDYVPTFMPRLRQRGFDLSDEFFKPFN